MTARVCVFISLISVEHRGESMDTFFLLFFSLPLLQFNRGESNNPFQTEILSPQDEVSRKMTEI